MTYRGRVADLLGLNWCDGSRFESSHGGGGGHSGFNLEVFWKHPRSSCLPELTNQQPSEPERDARQL